PLSPIIEVLRVFDCHIHVQPWEQLKPQARATMTGAREDLPEVARALEDPNALLSLLDAQGVEKAALINYVAPEVMGFVETVNDWVSRFVRGHEDRLIAVGSVHPRHSKDTHADTARLFTEQGIRLLKIHPPHQVFAANAYREDLPSLAGIYAAAQEHGRPIMIHTGTSVFPGARNRYADPMA